MYFQCYWMHLIFHLQQNGRQCFNLIHSSPIFIFKILVCFKLFFCHQILGKIRLLNYCWQFYLDLLYDNYICGWGLCPLYQSIHFQCYTLCGRISRSQHFIIWMLYVYNVSVTNSFFLVAFWVVRLNFKKENIGHTNHISTILAANRKTLVKQIHLDWQWHLHVILLGLWRSSSHIHTLSIHSLDRKQHCYLKWQF